MQLVIFSLLCMSYTTASLLSNPNCPTSYTGAPRATTPNLGQVRYCNTSGCHQDFALNNAGGSVAAIGLPNAKYVPGQLYNFSIKINHATANRTIWGFAIKAVNTVDNKNVGTFSSTNPAATLKGLISSSSLELSHANATTTPASNSFSYINLSWTAPALPTPNESNIRFYITGNAGNGDGGEAGDYIYTTTVNASLSTLPLTLGSFNITEASELEVKIQWQTLQEFNTKQFEIETSADGINWNSIKTIAAKGKSNSTQTYFSIDKKPAAFNATIFYRLKMIDENNSFTYSDIKNIRLKNSGIVIKNLSAQPLQLQQNGLLEVHSIKAGNILLAVFNINGNSLYNKTTIINKGVNRIEIPFNNFTKMKGTYFVKINCNGFEKVIQQIIN